MHTSNSRTRTAVAGAALSAVALVLLAPTAAGAHVQVTPSSTQAGEASELAFSFRHGCDGSPTTAVAVTIPEEVTAVGLIANAGWDVALDETSGARLVRFTADEPLPDGLRETLEVEVTLPEDAADGTVLAFPTLQACEVGETDWSSVDQEADAPAPILTVGEASGRGHGADADDGTQAAGTAAGVADDTGPAAIPIAVSALIVAIFAAGIAGAAALRRRPGD